MKVRGLKDFDQHISPLSLTFQWTRVFSSLAFSLSLSLCCAKLQETQLYICKYLSGAFLFVFFNLHRPQSDQRILL